MAHHIENIIAIRERNIMQADEAFAHFMNLTEQCLNERTRHDKKLYKNCSPFEMEQVTLSTLREIAPQTPFRAEQIQLVSGARFPDIQAERFYGVEVKTTKSDSWTSTGSSIFENTRIEDVANIYMCFGNLGGTPAEFRLRPYQKCLSNIAVTHAPRYLIDMEIADKEDEDNIFEKMNVDYNSFRIWGEREKYEKLKSYVAASMPKDKGMPWWIGENATVPMVIRFLNDSTVEEKLSITAQIFILCPEVFGNKSRTKFRRAALWLCSRQSMICSNFRDLFTSGGKVSDVGGVHFPCLVPQIIKTLYNCKDIIRQQLNAPSAVLLNDMNDFWSGVDSKRSYMEQWFGIVQAEFDKVPDLKNLRVHELFDKW